ncbi:MAG: methylated-DNA--[protein]-cysteine S-methyltransferase [Bacteroidaceae bacterium]|nr:methylated-DNA--[protein]-cysteine S-methyltransferase [Bacteroidaceae bacterium]
MDDSGFAVYDTSFGVIKISYAAGFITNVDFVSAGDDRIGECHNFLSDRTYAELEEYFKGERKVFDLPLNLIGTDFQKKVWSALCEIPYGETCSYKDIAVAVGKPNASRAVGMANHRNPIVIIVPCHRVVGANGSLVGYGGGLDRKKWLLDLEKNHK